MTFNESDYHLDGEDSLTIIMKVSMIVTHTTVVTMTLALSPIVAIAIYFHYFPYGSKLLTNRLLSKLSVI